MANWTRHSLVRGIRTTRWPRRPETSPGVTPGRPCPGTGGDDVVSRCPTGALTGEGDGAEVNLSRCISCQRCRHGGDALAWAEDFEWSEPVEDARAPLPGRFGRSLHVRYIDAGACGGCVGEVRLIDAPPYNLHRFGIFVTPTPRDADVLLIAGPVTEAMRGPVRKAYEAMPEPRRVVAMGVCAIDGGIFGKSFASAGGAGEVVPVDVLLPGCPPPPLAIIHALLTVAGRVPTEGGT
jgi:Ni,Fe-hydrogenase III small subunit